MSPYVLRLRKLKSLTLHTHGCLASSLENCSSLLLLRFFFLFSSSSSSSSSFFSYSSIVHRYTSAIPHVLISVILFSIIIVCCCRTIRGVRGVSRPWLLRLQSSCLYSSTGSGGSPECLSILHRTFLLFDVLLFLLIFGSGVEPLSTW